MFPVIRLLPLFTTLIKPLEIDNGTGMLSASFITRLREVPLISIESSTTTAMPLSDSAKISTHTSIRPVESIKLNIELSSTTQLTNLADTVSPFATACVEAEAVKFP